MKNKLIMAWVLKNRWGNMRGYRTRQQSIELGCDEWHAKEWLAAQQESGADIHPKSYISADVVAEHVRRLK